MTKVSRERIDLYIAIFFTNDARKTSVRDEWAKGAVWSATLQSTVSNRFKPLWSIICAQHGQVLDGLFSGLDWRGAISLGPTPFRLPVFHPLQSVPNP
jgi:hypothetical protein